MSSIIGREIGIYRITERLGQGGMGTVFKAVDTTLDRVVALKVLNPEVADTPELVQRFHAEARVQAGLSHPNLATLYAFLVWEGRPVMVMEFIEGETFQSMIFRRGPIPSDVSVPMFRQALFGLGAAHRRGIIHRDIKPANIMLNDAGVVKVMDFGIAKVLGVSGATRTDMRMGTSWYMAPEQIMTNNVDARADIYALGVTLYEMLAGQLPLQGANDIEVQMAHLERIPDPPTVYYPHIPPHIVAATMKALAKRPEDRFATADEFVHALDGTAPGVISSQGTMYSTPVPAVSFAANPAGPQTMAQAPPPAPPPPPPPAQATQYAAQYAPHFTPAPPPPGPGVNKWMLMGGGSAVAVLAIAGGLMYSSSVSHQHELEQQRIIAQRQDAENKRQAAIRQQREEEIKAEEQRTARELTDRVKREQEAAEADAQAQARARNQAAAERSARLAAQQAAQRAAQQATQRGVQGGTQQQSGVAPGVNTANVYQRLNGMWRGTYVCAQGQTAAQVLINATPQGVTAAMAFAVPNAKPGTFLMSGNFAPSNGQLSLQFVRWGNRPANYLPANLVGTVDLNQGVITGRVIAPGCSTFVIRRQ
jgi:serine/threonine-protein kinase